MSGAALPTVHQWLDHAQGYVAEVSGALDYANVYDGEPMRLASQIDIESDPVQWLQYYASYMAYFNESYTLWDRVHKFLERRFNQILAQSAAINKGSKGSASEIKYRYRDLDDAIGIAEARYLKAKAELKTAETYRDTVSRSMVAIQKERSVTKQW